MIYGSSKACLTRLRVNGKTQAMIIRKTHERNMKLTFPGPLISHVLLSFEEKFHGDDGILFGWAKSKSLHFVLLCKEIEKKKKVILQLCPIQRTMF